MSHSADHGKKSTSGWRNFFAALAQAGVWALFIVLVLCVLAFFFPRQAGDFFMYTKAVNQFKRAEVKAIESSDFYSAEAQDATNKKDLGDKLRSVNSIPRQVPAPAPVLSSAPPPVSASPIQQVARVQGVIVDDPQYDTIKVATFAPVESNPTEGEYTFVLDPRIANELTVIPAAGQTWTFEIKAQVCAWGFSCLDADGWAGHVKPGEKQGSDRQKYNVDDFPAQNAYQEEAVAYTGDGILEVGKSYAWHVSPAAAGKPVKVGFNIRRSEADKAKGGAILRVRVTS